MKLIRFHRLLLSLVLGTSLLAQAEKAPTLPAALKGVAVAEIPAQAASLIAAAQPAQRAVTATEVISGAVKTYPAIASAIVGAVCTKCPDLAGAVAKAAISVQPKQAQLITQAAVAAAPGYKADIAKALVVLSESMPALKPTLSSVIASLQAPQLAGAAASTTTVVEGTSGNTGGRLRGPIVSGPYIPLSGTPTNTPPGTPVPPTGDYARP